MSFSEHEKAEEQGPRHGLPLISHVETKILHLVSGLGCLQSS